MTNDEADWDCRRGNACGLCDLVAALWKQVGARAVWEDGSERTRAYIGEGISTQVERIS